MTIPHIHVKDVDIPNVYVPDWMTRQPDVDRLVPPVVLNIGNPIVDIPGCVKMHRDNQYHNNGLPIDKGCLLYTSPSPRDERLSRMPSSA